MTRINPIRPKVKAAGQATVATAALTFGLRIAGVDVQSVPPEILIAAAGALATLAAYVKKDGLRGAWQRIVNGA